MAIPILPESHSPSFGEFVSWYGSSLDWSALRRSEDFESLSQPQRLRQGWTNGEAMTPRQPPANFLDRMFVFHPDPWIERDWARLIRVPLEDVWFAAEDGTRLFGWYGAARRPSAIMLWCHGNAGNMIHRLENLAMLYEYGFSVFLFDYRGYGRSGGTPSEKGLYQDARAAYQYLTDVRHIEPTDIVVFGRSLGAAVAGNLVAERT